jgi:hypothetical protein
MELSILPSEETLADEFVPFGTSKVILFRSQTQFPYPSIKVVVFANDFSFPRMRKRTMPEIVTECRDG